MCGQPLTHYVVVPQHADRWVERRAMSVMATPYCTACSPAVDHAQASVPPVTPLDLPPTVTWLERWARRWLLAPDPQESPYADA